MQIKTNSFYADMLVKVGFPRTNKSEWEDAVSALLELHMKHLSIQPFTQKIQLFIDYKKINFWAN